MKTYFIKTFGCQANESDSERIEGDYQARGYKPAASWKKADEIIVNTCAVRQRAEDRAKGFINNVASHFNIIKRTRPKIILTGCMTHHGEKKLLELIPNLDQVLPINEVGFNQTSIRRDKTHAWVAISQGCNSFCTFCIVPYSRGREKSRPMDDILREVTRSQIPPNITQYLRPKGIPTFVKLLQEISKINEIDWVRFITSNPWDFHDALIDEIARNKKIDRFIHLPVQSGSDRILKLMNRGYTKADYLRLIKKLKAAAPDVIIGTDIIVGFPTETDQDFRQTVDLARQADWVIAFAAQYSPRPGTAAWRIYPDDVPPKIKKQRWEILDELINKKNLNRRPVF
ncbi:MAG: (Dimethylallyl)adenosine tRNA methylthiotransferase MiaB [Candidatus Woesebacteria bacterium GW2011_GWA2_44_33]|uniref:tRNA-2-methylthio-N(6)-dimethylallyladenosine synthase n=1 Tax=Candidatus Woesebacteria bacterium GW2011_GWA2_44_33 TaxID=1618564 RepID=A0A0G1LA25_9BACT|nr:MAG: (Dimethylallyl)adenosine tRNA methylthiotransferase MiaB [Candidatus Woesebacteria bacterium GW2011_GWA2_44_33]